MTLIKSISGFRGTIGGKPGDTLNPLDIVKFVSSYATLRRQAVKAGDNIVILESMKMEIPVVAPQDGTVASIDVAEGASVENGDTLATMN